MAQEQQAAAGGKGTGQRGAGGSDSMGRLDLNQLPQVAPAIPLPQLFYSIILSNLSGCLNL